MNKPVLYIFYEDGTLDEIETDIKEMKEYIRKYESYTERVAEKTKRDSKET